jgi:hypothetical protein
MQRLLRDSNIVHPRRDRLWPWAALVNDRQRVLELEGYYNTIWVTTVQSDIAQEKDNISSGCHCTALAHAPEARCTHAVGQTAVGSRADATEAILKGRIVVQHLLDLRGDARQDCRRQAIVSAIHLVALTANKPSKGVKPAHMNQLVLGATAIVMADEYSIRHIGAVRRRKQMGVLLIVDRLLVNWRLHTLGLSFALVEVLERLRLCSFGASAKDLSEEMHSWFGRLGNRSRNARCER